MKMQAFAIYVHYRVGSLEKERYAEYRYDQVHYRVGSLENSGSEIV